MLHMAREVVQYCLTMFVALVMNHTYGIAGTVGGMFTTTIAVLTMLVLTAIDIPGTQRSILNYGT